TSSGGVLRVPITCSSAGAVGNADDGTALILVTPVNGLPSSGVADTLTGGFDTEELETWRARVIERYYWTPQGGADGDYVVWAKEMAARQHIGPLAPVAGSDLYVFRPVAHTVDFHIRVTPDTPEIRAAITAELRSFLLRDGYPQGELKVSRISEAISGANGEYSHQLLAPADNISIAKNELAVLGTISWT
ncbi:baseplate J/gp47 family protein, partial [Escherichia coli]|uniref:baseplate J/gp47 family protein n=1 Tax=Escherichia coli TaxID=562 RepID=UPI00271AA96D